MTSAEQIKAARALLRMEQDDLARRSGVSITTIRRLEAAQGAGLVAPLPGSAHAKRRLTLFLQSLSGQCSVGQACAELGIGESRFFAQRAAWLEESLALLEPRSAGRPPKPPLPTDEREVQVLREQVRQLEARLAVAEVRSELACVLPRVVGAACAGKKTT
jgi:transcriptional regulator with XRE-family HTH domain